MIIELFTITCNGGKREKFLKHRLERIDFYHLGIGADAAVKNNYEFGPKVFIGIGSTHNLVNADFGLKLMLANPWRNYGSEYCRWFSLPIFVSGSINALRWKRNSIYVGAEIAYKIGMGSGYHTLDSSYDRDTKNIATNHFSCQGKLGYRSEYWGLALYYEYDLAPALDQKYVYESPSYNYPTIHDSVFERWRVGVSVEYNFRF